MCTARVDRTFKLALAALACVVLASATRADDAAADLRKQALALNSVTGDETIRGKVKALVADPKGTKKLALYVR